MRLHWDAVSTLAKAHHMEEPTSGLDAFTRFLKWWWCQKFNKPMKDPLLESYTLDELLYEYLRYYYSTPENDPRKELEAKRVKDDEDAWIRKQLERVQQAAPPQKEEPKKAAPSQEAPTPEMPDISTKFE
jgi:ABC-type multidrug transport system ATPase subunit